jgi:hypothetical protein
MIINIILDLIIKHLDCFIKIFFEKNINENNIEIIKYISYIIITIMINCITNNKNILKYI